MKQLARGVWTAPYLSDNMEAVVIMVDSRGCKVREVAIPQGTPPAEVVADLKEELERIDPAYSGMNPSRSGA